MIKQLFFLSSYLLNLFLACHFAMVQKLACPNDSGSDAIGSLASGRATQGGKIKDEEPDKEQSNLQDLNNRQSYQTQHPWR